MIPKNTGVRITESTLLEIAKKDVKYLKNFTAQNAAPRTLETKRGDIALNAKREWFWNRSHRRAHFSRYNSRPIYSVCGSASYDKVNKMYPLNLIPRAQVCRNCLRILRNDADRF